MASNFTFLPSIRTALTAATKGPAPSSARRRVTLDVEIQADGKAAGNRLALGADVLGAGDIVAIDRAAIVRVEPASGLRGFEPAYMPFIEFVDADFPWRYSLDVDANDGRTLPWMVLIALTPDEFEFADQGNGPLPRIRVSEVAKSLPDLEQSWAYAHAHVHRADPKVALADVLRTQPDAQLSRLLCPRRLKPTATYHLFLVPTFEAGRLAGLGGTAAAAPWNKLSWAARETGSVELPVYFQSRFVTSSLEDLEQLVRRLKPYKIDPRSPVGAVERASASQPGYYLDYSKPGAAFDIPTALSRTGAAAAPFDTDPALADRLAATLGQVIAGEAVPAAKDGPSVEDPLVAMPPYGFRYGPFKTLARARAALSQWFDRTNLDLKYRYAAGLGAEIVRRCQESFTSLCWQQYRDIVAANRQLIRLRLAERMATRIGGRRLGGLPADVVVALAEPLHPLTPFGKSRSLSDELESKSIPASFVSRSLRQVAAKRPVLRKVPMPGLPGAAVAAPVRPRAVAAPTATTDAARVQAFRTALGALVAPDALSSAKAAPPIPVPVGAVDAKALGDAVVNLTRELPNKKAGFVVGGRTPREARAIAPIMRAPRVAVPLADELRKVAPDALLGGLPGLPDNTVTVVEENRAFIEALLVGANHELNNELRWREFPTDMRGTVLPRFWNRGRGAEDVSGDDIGAIHAWSKVLGRNLPAHDRDAQANLALVIRGDVIRKLGDAVIVLNRATGTTWKPNDGVDTEPAFFGRLRPDVAFYGFDVAKATIQAAIDQYFFVIYEPVGQLRFGLDVATAAIRNARTDHSTAPLPFPLLTMKRDRATTMPKLSLAKPKPVDPQPATWDDLSWTHVTLTGSQYVDMQRTRVKPTTGADLWGTGRTSASIARSFWQRPIAAVIAAKKVL